MKEELLIRYLMRQCSPEELEQVARWIGADEANAAQFFEIERIWILKDEARYKEPKVLNSAYNQLLYGLKKKDLLHTKSKIHFFHWLGYVAAVILLGILVVDINLNREESKVAMNIIEVPNGQRVNMILSDGTKVSLNAGSSFAYPSDFSTKSRTVRLIGEGYFEVARNVDKPFIVSMPLLDVKVLGTKFNINAYSGQDTEVTLEKGEVEVFVNGSSGKADQNGCKLYPDQQLKCTQAKQVTLRKVNVEDAKDWLNDVFLFDNQNLYTIAKELERRFGVDIRIQEPELAEEVFTCHTKAGASLTQILDVLVNTKKITYIQNENKYVLLTPKSK